MPDMRLLFDQNTSFRIMRRLPACFADCRHVREVGLIDCDDEIVWRFAKQNGFAVVTFDADFSKKSVIKGAPPKIVWLRTGNLTNSELIELLILNFASISKFIDSPTQNCLEVY